MAYTITNRAPFSTGAIPLVRVELADQTADVAAQDMGVAGLKFLKVRMLIKAQVGTFAMRVNVSPVVGMTTPEYLIQSETLADGEPICREWWGWSNAGFQFVNLDVTLGTSATFDVEITGW
jgi:hypothetical protein